MPRRRRYLTRERVRNHPIDALMRARATPLLAVALAVSLVGSATPARAADAAAGKRFFKKCAACHNLTADRHKIGPGLSGLFGRRAATALGYKRYSKSMKAAGARGLIWNESEFLQYIASPNQFLRDFLGDPKARSNMTFAGIKQQQDRENLLAYLLEATN